MSSYPASMSEAGHPQPHKYLKVGIFIWFVLMFAGLMYYTTQRLVDFDPEAALLDNSLRQTFYTDLKTLLTDEFGAVNGRAFHFSQSDCFCQVVAAQHISDVSAMIAADGQENILVSTSDMPNMADFLPSTPAIAMYNDSGELMYIGPYSTGYLCTAGNGLVEDLIPDMKQAETGQIIMSLARGCYCNF